MAVLLLYFHAFVVLLGFSTSVAAQTYSCPYLGSMMDCSRKGLIEVPRDLPSWITILELQSNGISSIQEDAFTGLHLLEKLDLSNNEITSINETVFQSLPALKDLKLNYNKLSEIPKLGKNSNITHLYLQHNRIHTFTAEALAGLSKLRTLDLNFNNVMDIPLGTFPVGSKLHQLFLNNNRIISLDAGALDNLTSLEWLKLNKNNISRLPKNIFEKLKKLKYLELTRNKFRTIDGLMFNGLENLQALKLRRNQISILMDGAFYGLNNIQNLHLDHNNISAVTKGWLYGLISVQQLSLAHNNIQFIESDGWEFCSLLQDLDLRYNKLTMISEGTFGKLHVLRYLYLDHNNISHIEDGAFKGLTSLQNLEMNHNEISWTVEDMDGAFAGLDHLSRLGLDSNRIKSIAKRAFTGLESLKQLQLTDNGITSIQDNAFLPMRDLQELHLNSSNLLCDCHLSWLPNWLKASGFETSVKAVCAHPEWLKGKTVFDIDPDDFKCKDFLKPEIIQEPKSAKTLKGANVTLQCVAACSGSYKTVFQWRKDNVIMRHGETENLASQDGDITKYTSKLHIRNIQDDAAGKYQCIISNQFGSAYSKKTEITVHVYPWFTKTPVDVTVKAGSTAKLECAAKGQPPPQIAFQKDGGDDFPAARERRMHVMPTDDVFFIVSVKSSDEGVYSCTATNDAGTIIANASLTVLETPSFVRPMDDKFTIQGQTTVLECLSSGSPKPKLSWLKDDQPLEVTQRHFFTANNQLLIIVQTQPSDMGKYTCEMSNTLGTKRDESTLTVLQADGSPIQGGYEGGMGGLDDESTTTGIIIIAVVCCVVGTSLVWVIIIYQTRKRHEEYSTTPTDETTLPGEIPSSSCNSSEKEANYLTGTFAGTGYHYHDYQLKEVAYDPGGGRGYPIATFGCVSSKGRPAAIFPRDVDSDHQQYIPLTLGEHQPAQNSGGNSISSLQYPNSETDSVKSSHSTDSTRMSGQEMSTLRTFRPRGPTNHDRLGGDGESQEGEGEPETVAIIHHRYPSTSSLSSPHHMSPSQCTAQHSTAHDRHHGAQPPGPGDQSGCPGGASSSVYNCDPSLSPVVHSHSNPAVRLIPLELHDSSSGGQVKGRPLSCTGASSSLASPASPVNTHYGSQSLTPLSTSTSMSTSTCGACSSHKLFKLRPHQSHECCSHCGHLDKLSPSLSSSSASPVKSPSPIIPDSTVLSPQLCDAPSSLHHKLHHGNHIVTMGDRVPPVAV